MQPPTCSLDHKHQQHTGHSLESTYHPAGELWLSPLPSHTLVGCMRVDRRSVISENTPWHALPTAMAWWGNGLDPDFSDSENPYDYSGEGEDPYDEWAIAPAHAMGWGLDSDELEGSGSDFSGTDGEDWSEEDGPPHLAYNHEVGGCRPCSRSPACMAVTAVEGVYGSANCTLRFWKGSATRSAIRCCSCSSCHSQCMHGDAAALFYVPVLAPHFLMPRRCHKIPRMSSRAPS
jgi:hypothetical protein